MSSLNLTEFFNDDDSDGHRLAEFLQKRRGVVKQQNRLYHDGKTGRKSLKVQLEKLPQIQKKNENKNKSAEKGAATGVSVKETEQYEGEKSVEEQLAELHGENGEKTTPPAATTTPPAATTTPPPQTLSPKTGPVSPSGHTNNLGYLGSSPNRNDNSKKPALSPTSPSRNNNRPPAPPLSPASPSRNNNRAPAAPLSPSSPSRNNNRPPPLSPVIPFISSRVFSSPAPLSPSRPVSPARPLISPRLSAVLKSGGRVSPIGDRLRRLSLKRLTTKVQLGRRTLLGEFEQTLNDDNFQPPLCSTPLTQQQPVTNPTSQISSTSSPVGTENQEPNASNKPTPTSNESCCGHTDTLIQTLQRKDEELKKYMNNMNNILETTFNKIQQQKETEKTADNGTYTMSNSQTSVNKNNNQSPLKRTYTVEKGSTPGQVILTPERLQSSHLRSHMETSPQQNRSLRSREATPNNILKTPEYGGNRSMISIRVKSPCNLLKSPQTQHNKSLRVESPKRSLGRSAIMLEKAKATKKQNLTNKDVSIIYPTQELEMQNVEILNNTPERNVSIVFNTQPQAMDIDIPETEEIPETQEPVLSENENHIIINSPSNTSMVVIPINHAYNQSPMKTALDNNSNTISKPKNMKNITKTPSPKTINAHISSQIPEDQLKYSDIFTDDEENEKEVTPKVVSSSKDDNNSQAPLNLATSSKNVRTKRLRKRILSRRRLQMERTHLLPNETESEQQSSPPAAHTNNNSPQRRLRSKIKKITLNRAPGTPLNGERYAKELQRMSNYEILDLRKRNSMGRVFALTGRKSTRSQEEANKKQLQLDDDIEMELLRRKMEKSNAKLQEKTIENVVLTDEEEEYPAVPEQFRDLSKQMEQESEPEQQNDNEPQDNDDQDLHPADSSLVDEKSTDRISFKPNTSNSKSKNNFKKISKRRRAKSVPEVLKQYLEVTTLLKTKNKLGKTKIDITKRSLYTQGNSDSEEINANSSGEKQELQHVANDKASNAQQSEMEVNEIPSLQYVPSPPPSETDQMPELRVVSPPPPLTLDVQEEIPQERSADCQDNEIQIESQQEHQEDEVYLAPPPPEFDSDSNSNITHNPIESTASSVATTSKDDFVFKKPMAPPPVKKKNVKKSQKSNILVNDMQATDETNNLDTTTVRRSKRQVSQVKPVSIFTIMFQENYSKLYKARERRLERLKEKEREMSKAMSKSKLPKTTTTKKSTKKSPTKYQAPIEDEAVALLQKDMEILNKNPEKDKEKIKKKKSKKKQTPPPPQTEEQFECSKINLSVAPPAVDHFNNVFDQLSQATEEHTASSGTSAAMNNLKIKNFKIKLKRFKADNLSTGIHNSPSSSSSHTNNYLVNKDHTTKNTNSTVSSSTSTDTCYQSNCELISWLKNVTQAENVQSNEELIKEMRISAASNLSFSTIQGVEYAFYDTDKKASLGYLRFKPGQKKPKKKAKSFNLQFLPLVGQFRVRVNDKERLVGVGDLVAIDKTVYYDIENLTDDIGILMVMKQ